MAVELGGVQLTQKKNMVYKSRVGINVDINVDIKETTDPRVSVSHVLEIDMGCRLEAVGKHRNPTRGTSWKQWIETTESYRNVL